MPSAKWFQKKIRLRERRRGMHLVTEEIVENVPEIAQVKIGLVHFFIQHSSASLTLNENADPDVRRDMETHLNHMIPEGASYFTHTTEGSDDMPAHIKASLLGASLTIPVSSGTLQLGTWQGVYLCEHRNHGGRRGVVVTVFGE